MKMKSKRTTRVLAFGTFDILHPGHIAYLTYAKQQGETLAVIIARDSSVRKIKGSLPLFTERDRLRMVRTLRMVDIAFLGDRKDHYRSIEKTQPDIICLGYDHRISEDALLEELKKRNIRISKIVRAKKYHAGEYKSSIFKQKIKH